jgi:Carboxypeptidase regulatory-like domain
VRPYLPLFLALIVGLLSISSASFAQETTATILRTVSDESGGVLPGVSMTPRHGGANQTFERVTTSEALYTAPLLPIGEYEITFTLARFQSPVIRGVTLSVNDRIVVDARFTVGGVMGRWGR